MLLVQETIDRFGYDPRQLKQGSNKRIVATCDQCGKLRIVEFRWLNGHCPDCAKRRKRITTENSELKCSNCGKTLDYRSQKKFCSNQCGADYLYKQYIEQWLAGTVDGSQSEVWTSRHIRRYLHETRSSQCELCGWGEQNPFTGKIPLHMHHIDGNYKNNRPENLQLLCPNCHSLTATYGSQNRGSGRPYKVYKTAR